ncbi:MAG: ParA family protein [Sphingomonas sp.]
MRVLAVASQKGGSGKTMLATHLAVQAGATGAGPVVLVDIDPQGALATWWAVRGEATPAFAQTTPERAHADIEMLRQRGFRLAIIDTPPLASPPVGRAIAEAALVLVPTRPHADDLRVAAGTVDLCAQQGKPMLFVVNGGAADAVMGPEALLRLAQHGPVAPHVVPQTPGLSDAMLSGRTLGEATPAHLSAGRIDALWAYVSGRMEKNFRRTVFAVPRQAAGGFGRRGL